MVEGDRRPYGVVGDGAASGSVYAENIHVEMFRNNLKYSLPCRVLFVRMAYIVLTVRCH